MNKKTVVFINNVIMDINTPIHRIKYELLSEQYDGFMFYLSNDRHCQDVGNFRCFSYPYYNPLKRLVRYTAYCLRKSLTLKHIDAIVVNDPLLPGLVGYVIKLFTGAKLIVEVNTHNVSAMALNNATWFSRLKNKLVPMVIRFIFSRADGVKFVNTILRETLSGSYDLSGKEVRSFFDFVPTTVFSRQLPETPAYIFSAGFPYHIKGIDVLIRAFNLIHSEFPGLRLKITGHCPDLAPYLALAGGNSAIEFNKGVPYSEIISQFEKCLFFVLASRTEGLPRAIIDAMASGKAVVASRVGGIPELIEDGLNGYLFDSENHLMLAEKMKALLRDEPLRQQMGAAGFQVIQERYTPEHYVDNYHELISTVLGSAQVEAGTAH
jgi:glycosyltransferase involved in cell wall biosynthesis